MHNELMTASFAAICNDNPSPLVHCTQKVKQILGEQKTNAKFKEYFYQDLMKRAKESIEKMLLSAKDGKQMTIYNICSVGVENILSPFTLVFLTNELLNSGFLTVIE